MAFMDRVRNLFRPASPVSAPKPRLEGSADWTRREIEAAQRVDGRSSLSAESQATVDREIAAAKVATLKQQRPNLTDEQAREVVRLTGVPSKVTVVQGAAGVIPFSPEAQQAVNREIKAARTLGEASQDLANDRRPVASAPHADVIKRGRSHTLG